MKKSALTITICVLGILFRAHASTGVSDTNLSGRHLQAQLIADYFGVDLPTEVYVSQSDRLNNEWFERFRVRSDLNRQAIVRFLVTYPDQLVPVRDYLQQLINADIMEYSDVLDTLGTALNQIALRHQVKRVDGNNENIPLPDPASFRSSSFFQSSGDSTQLIRNKTKFITGSDNAKLVMGSEDGRPTYGISYLKAFDKNGNRSGFPYFQVDLQKNTNPNPIGRRVSLGFGYRGVSPNDQIMFGLNLFHDWDLDQQHRRGSIGFTVDSAPFKLSGNRYVGLSGEKDVSSTIEQGVADISILGAKIQVPYLTNTYLSYDKFWLTGGNIADIGGSEIGVKTHLSDHISLELSEVRWDSPVSLDQYRAKLRFHWLPTTPSSFSNTMFSRSSLGLDRYVIVERDPILLYSRYEVFSSSSLIEEVVQEEVVQEEVVQEEVVQEEVVQEEVVQEEVVQEEVVQDELQITFSAL